MTALVRNGSQDSRIRGSMDWFASDGHVELLKLKDDRCRMGRGATLDRVRLWLDSEDAGLDRRQVETGACSWTMGRSPRAMNQRTHVPGDQLAARTVPERVFAAIDLDVDEAGLGGNAQRDGTLAPLEETVPVGNGHLESVASAAGMPLAVVPSRSRKHGVGHQSASLRTCCRTGDIGGRGSVARRRMGDGVPTTVHASQLLALFGHDVRAVDTREPPAALLASREGLKVPETHLAQRLYHVDQRLGDPMLATGALGLGQVPPVDKIGAPLFD